MKLAAERKQLLERLRVRLQTAVDDWELFNQALTHESYTHENLEELPDNERLEFLGDAVLGLVISQLLYQRFPHWREGEMARMKGFLVSSERLSHKATDLELGTYLLLGRGEESTGGRERTSLLADVMEAILGVLYLEGGMERAAACVEVLYREDLDITEPEGSDYKSRLQELIQKRHQALPHYRVQKEEGPAHLKKFQIQVSFRGEVMGVGEGPSKKEAEQAAAEAALERLAAQDETGSRP